AGAFGVLESPAPAAFVASAASSLFRSSSSCLLCCSSCLLCCSISRRNSASLSPARLVPAARVRATQAPATYLRSSLHQSSRIESYLREDSLVRSWERSRQRKLPANRSPDGLSSVPWSTRSGNALALAVPPR